MPALAAALRLAALALSVLCLLAVLASLMAAWSFWEWLAASVVYGGLAAAFGWAAGRAGR